MCVYVLNRGTPINEYFTSHMFYYGESQQLRMNKLLVIFKQNIKLLTKEAG